MALWIMVSLEASSLEELLPFHLQAICPHLLWFSVCLDDGKSVCGTSGSFLSRPLPQQPLPYDLLTSKVDIGWGGCDAPGCLVW